MSIFSKTEFPVIGMVHLDPMLGKPGFNKQQLLDHAKADIETLQEGGITAIMLENDNDKPYSEYISTSEAVSFAWIAAELVKQMSVPFGFTVLLNDWQAALSLSVMFGGKFVRLDTFVDSVTRVDDGIVINPDPKRIMKFKSDIGADGVDLYTDVHVKHTTMNDAAKPLQQSIAEAVDAGTNGIVITGSWTGTEPDTKEIELASEIAETPVIIGSGFSVANAKMLTKIADGAIVGSSLKTGDRVDVQKVKHLMEIIPRS